MQTEGALLTSIPVTRDDVIALKESWLRDPCYDLAEVSGFEAYRDELQTFQDEHEQRQNLERNRELHARAENLGCPGNLQLVRYVERLEDKLERLERRIAQMEERISWRA